VAYKDRGVVAFDLAGAEYNYPAKKHKDAFYTVINKNMAATIHAGEAYGPESIHQALHYCNAHRIGHGTRLFEDPDLMRYVNDFRVPIEICLTSNVQTRAVASFETHPLRQYYDAGIVLSLNTDNRLMSATTVTEEFWRAHQYLGFTWDELVEIALMGFDSSFMHRQEKLAMIEQGAGGDRAAVGAPHPQRRSATHPPPPKLPGGGGACMDMCRSSGLGLHTHLVGARFIATSVRLSRRADCRGCRGLHRDSAARGAARGGPTRCRAKGCAPRRLPERFPPRRRCRPAGPLFRPSRSFSLRTPCGRTAPAADALRRSPALW
jgi:hypothetical protein